MPWPATIPTFTAGVVASEAQLDAITDALSTIGNSWTTFTPALTASTNPNVGTTGTIRGRYVLAGKLLLFDYVVTFGGTGIAGGTGTWNLALPAGLTIGGSTGGRRAATGLAYDSSGTDDYPIRGKLVQGATTIPLATLPTTAGNALVGLGGATPFAVAAGDVYSLSGLVEVA
jgi:hypothetical protein